LGLPAWVPGGRFSLFPFPFSLSFRCPLKSQTTVRAVRCCRFFPIGICYLFVYRSFVSLGVARGRSPLHRHKGKGKSRDDAASLPAASKSLIVYRSGSVRHLVINRDSSVAIAKSLTSFPRKPIVCSALWFFRRCGSATAPRVRRVAGRKPLPEANPYFRFAPLGAKRGFGKPAQICSVRCRESGSAKKGGRSRTRFFPRSRPHCRPS
jgi:hypothetical protein